MILLTGVLIIFIFILLGFIMLNSYRKFKGVYDGDIIIIPAMNFKEDKLRLNSKLDYAMDLLNQLPNSVCILCGGYNENENTSDSYYMKQYLLFEYFAKNIFILEDSSKDLRTSIKYSSEIIKRRNLNRKVIIVSDDFTQARAQIYCKKYGLYSSGYDIRILDNSYLFNFMKEILLYIKLLLIHK